LAKPNYTLGNQPPSMAAIHGVFEHEVLPNRYAVWALRIYDLWKKWYP
jgi:hypothetical protein